MHRDVIVFRTTYAILQSAEETSQKHHVIMGESSQPSLFPIQFWLPVPQQLVCIIDQYIVQITVLKSRFKKNHFKLVHGLDQPSIQTFMRMTDKLQIINSRSDQYYLQQIDTIVSDKLQTKLPTEITPSYRCHIELSQTINQFEVPNSSWDKLRLVETNQYRRFKYPSICQSN